MKNEALNQAALWRTKSYCSISAHGISPWDNVNPDEDRYRFAFRSGPLAHAAYCSAIIMGPYFPWLQYNGAVRLNLHTSATEAAVVASQTFEYGPANYTGLAASGWEHIRVIDKFIDITPNTDYYALVRNIQGGHVISFCMFELASLTENFDGYLPQNISAQNPILDLYRQNQSELLQTLWEGYGGVVFTWTVDPGPWDSGDTGSPYTYKVTSSSTLKNILDLTSTGVSANTPGWYPDMQLKNRASQTSGVPCTMKAFGKMASGTGGKVVIKDSGGTIIASIAGGWSTTPGWQSVNFNLPATSAKYDVQWSNNGSGSFGLWAVSLYESG